jgi:hypothetical protein
MNTILVIKVGGTVIFYPSTKSLPLFIEEVGTLSSS